MTSTIERKRSSIEAMSRPARGRMTPSPDAPVVVSALFGELCFDQVKWKETLPPSIYEKLALSAQNHTQMDAEVARHLAEAVKDWAVAKGATHYCHWFQPQTGNTAEKHDAFIGFGPDGKIVEEFSAAQLIQSEPDASSFPSGGLRATFEARGYSAWNPNSPMFIQDVAGVRTLCIPSIFIGYNGDALDEKLPFLRSLANLAQKAKSLIALLGESGVDQVITTLGTEQEYFLVDRAHYAQRPDLVMTGRTLLGATPAKNQQLEDHYFGSIPSRVQSLMSEAEMELFRLGVPVKTRHNEVAPGQYESAPIFEEADVAVDHNQLTMEVFRRVAQKHHFKVLFHEKPFAGVNGSGKHCNWSLSLKSKDPALDGQNLLSPGHDPHQNLRFLSFLCATLAGIHRNAGVLRAGIASSGNDHRLGANEAPPAILSVFLGDLLNRVLDDIEAGRAGTGANARQKIDLGVALMPHLNKDNTDRNRTSPFAFTGNKFEFRAVGSSMNVAFPVALLNAAVADGIDVVVARIKAKGAKDGSAATPEQTIAALREIIAETKPVRFEGNGYADEWVVEAAKRGLPNLRKTPEALAQLNTPAAKRLCVEQKLFSESELHARYEARIERYVKEIEIEANVLGTMVESQVLPAALAQLTKLAEGVAALKAAGLGERDIPHRESLIKQARIAGALQDAVGKLTAAKEKAAAAATLEKKAELLAQDVCAGMISVRMAADELEHLVDDGAWSLPTYREMLFLN